MMRFGPLAFVVFLSMPASHATAAQRVSRPPLLLAELQEESIPAADLAPSASPAASPAGPAAAPATPAAAPSPAAEENPDTDDNSAEWEQVPAGNATPAGNTMPVSNPMPPPAAAAPPVSPADIAPAIDVGSIATTPQVSDASLQPLIDTAPTPARAASLRITEQERIELERGRTDDAIRGLAHAISIDPSDTYAYFYLGRAYIARKDYGQALTFFKRAEIGLASNSAWLGETYAFEGLSLEESGKSAEAVAAYEKALAASPGNLTARVGVTRLSAFLPATASAAAPATNLDQPAPAEPDAPPAPDEAPAPPPPAPPGPD
jgi:Tetratricopeptide repeat